MKKTSLLMVFSVVLALQLVSAGYSFNYDSSFVSCATCERPTISTYSNVAHPDIVYIQNGLYTDYISCYTASANLVQGTSYQPFFNGGIMKSDMYDDGMYVMNSRAYRY